MSANVGVMRIGEVHAQLRRDFPDVELSKIRYYEDKGLVQPSRSRKGYRLYSERDVDCLREAIRLAQEEFVPLRVVRLRLIEQGLLSGPPVTSVARQAARGATAAVRAVAPVEVVTPRPAPALSAPGDEPVPDVPPRRWMSTHELLETTGLLPEQFNQLQALGIVRPTVVGDETRYSTLDVHCADRARTLLDRGVDVRMIGALRRIAEREVGVIEEIARTAYPPSSKSSPADAAAAVADVAQDVAALRQAMVEMALVRSTLE